MGMLMSFLFDFESRSQQEGRERDGKSRRGLDLLEQPFSGLSLDFELKTSPLPNLLLPFEAISLSSLPSLNFSPPSEPNQTKPARLSRDLPSPLLISSHPFVSPYLPSASLFGQTGTDPTPLPDRFSSTLYLKKKS